MKSIKVIKKVLHLIFLILLIILLLASYYIKYNFSNTTITTIFFQLNQGVENAPGNSFITATVRLIPYFIVCFIVVYFLFYNILINKKITYLKTKPISKNKALSLKIGEYKKVGRYYHKVRQVYPFKFIHLHRIFFTIILFILVICVGLSNLKINEFIEEYNSSSTFIQKNYVDPKSINIEFPLKKRNLITIYMESMETTYFTKSQGGDWDYEIMPELYNLVNQENTISFSRNNKNSGLSLVYGTNWSTAALISSHTALPLKTDSVELLNNYTLGDLLKDNGYYNETISAGKSSFGGVYTFLSNHGFDNIIDIDSLQDYGFSIDQEDMTDWGFNDKYLYEIAQERLLQISSQNKPFNLILRTVDTHPNDELMNYYTETKYANVIENNFATASKLVCEFMEWLKLQDFYKDTTIVIIGDHLNYRTDIFLGHDNNNRFIYNAFINSAVIPYKSKNRQACLIDMYPTILSAIGVKIENEQIGLGINLFSDKKTIIEKYGGEKIYKELSARSVFYDNNFGG